MNRNWKRCFPQLCAWHYKPSTFYYYLNYWFLVNWGLKCSLKVLLLQVYLTHCTGRSFHLHLSKTTNESSSWISSSSGSTLLEGKMKCRKLRWYPQCSLHLADATDCWSMSWWWQKHIESFQSSVWFIMLLSRDNWLFLVQGNPFKTLLGFQNQLQLA